MALAGIAAYSDTSSDDEDSLPQVETIQENAENPNNECKDDPFTDEDSDKDRPTEYRNHFFDDSDDSTDQEGSNSKSTTTATATVSDKSTDSLPNPLRLPAPALGHTMMDNSVFGNKYAEEEKAKLAVLEKHVNMTEEIPTNDKVCFKFRKGQCRRGKNCRFSHDLGFQPTSYAQESQEKMMEAATLQSDNFPNEQETRRRKKPGVTNNLMPAKRAKQTLDKHRADERPWTMH